MLKTETLNNIDEAVKLLKLIKHPKARGIMEFCSGPVPRSSKEIMEHVGFDNHPAMSRYMAPLKANHLILMQDGGHVANVARLNHIIGIADELRRT